MKPLFDPAPGPEDLDSGAGGMSDVVPAERFVGTAGLDVVPFAALLLDFDKEPGMLDRPSTSGRTMLEFKLFNCFRPVDKTPSPQDVVLDFILLLVKQL